MMALDYAPTRRGLRRSRRSWRRDPLVVAAAILCAVLFLVVLARAAYGGTSMAGEQIRVQPGETLWSIATQHYPGDDVRTRVDEIISANHLQGGRVEAGETLLLPSP
jgi:type II secretory pathway component PulL